MWVALCFYVAYVCVCESVCVYVCVCECVSVVTAGYSPLLCVPHLHGRAVGVFLRQGFSAGVWACPMRVGGFNVRH